MASFEPGSYTCGQGAIGKLTCSTSVKKAMSACRFELTFRSLRNGRTPARSIVRAVQDDCAASAAAGSLAPSEADAFPSLPGSLAISGCACSTI